MDNIKDVNSSERESGEHIYVMTIELSEGQTATLKVFLDSKPEEQAFNFCKENNLDYNAMSNLTKQITELITKYANSLETKENKESECIQEVDEENTHSLSRVDSVKQKIKNKQSNNNKQCDKVENNKEQNVKIVKRKIPSKQKYIRNNNKDKNKFHNNNSYLKTIPNSTFSYEEFFKRFSSTSFYKKHFNKQILPKSNSNNATLTISSYNNNNNNHNTSTNNTTLNASSKPTVSIDKRQINHKDNSTSPVTPEEKRNIIKKLLHTHKTNNNISHKNKPLINNGERLYQTSIQSMELKKRKMEKYLTSLKNENNTKYTFKPNINKNTDTILKKSKSSSYYITLTKEKRNEILLNYKSFLETKHSQLQLKHKNPNESFTFEPNLNKNSIEIANRLNHSTDKALMKSKSYSKFSKVKDDMYKQCSFTPKINKKSFLSLKGNFHERMKEYQRKSQEKYNKLFIEINNPLDEYTGQELFKPSLYSSHSTYDIKRNEDVFSHLYNYTKQYQRKLNEIKGIRYLTATMNNKVNMNKISEKINHKSKYEMFEFIFNKIDIDGNGMLSTYNLNFEIFPEKVYNVLEPIKSFIKEETHKINKEQFIEIMNDLYGKISYNERKILKEYCKPNFYSKFINNNNDFTFQPTINKKSKMILEEKQKNITPLYYYK